MASIDGEVRRSDVGLVIILLIQVVIIFVIAPLASTGTASPQLVEGLRLGLAATTILIVARRRMTRFIIGIAFVATLAVPTRWQFEHPGAAIAATKTLVTIVFDIAVAGIIPVHDSSSSARLKTTPAEPSKHR